MATPYNRFVLGDRDQIYAKLKTDELITGAFELIELIAVWFMSEIVIVNYMALFVLRANARVLFKDDVSVRQKQIILFLLVLLIISVVMVNIQEFAS
jgi:hypothetical protein